MDPEILTIRLSEEAKRWDEMVDRLDDYLTKGFDARKALREQKL